jgi:hypothetical protein
MLNLFVNTVLLLSTVSILADKAVSTADLVVKKERIDICQTSSFGISSMEMVQQCPLIFTLAGIVVI